MKLEPTDHSFSSSTYNNNNLKNAHRSQLGYGLSLSASTPASHEKNQRISPQIGLECANNGFGRVSQSEDSHEASAPEATLSILKNDVSLNSAQMTQGLTGSGMDLKRPDLKGRQVFGC